MRSKKFKLMLVVAVLSLVLAGDAAIVLAAFSPVYLGCGSNRLSPEEARLAEELYPMAFYSRLSYEDIYIPRGAENLPLRQKVRAWSIVATYGSDMQGIIPILRIDLDKCGAPSGGSGFYFTGYTFFFVPAIRMRVVGGVGELGFYWPECPSPGLHALFETVSRFF